MMSSTSCKRVIFDESTKSLVTQIQAQMETRGTLITLDYLPSIQDVLPANFSDATEIPEVAPYPPPAQLPTLDSVSHYIHSSGSTGLPKSIHFTHARMLQMMRRGG